MGWQSLARAGGDGTEPKGKLKKLLAAEGDERLFLSTATARRAGSASACAEPWGVCRPLGVLHPEGMH